MNRRTLRIPSSGTIFHIEIQGIGKNISLPVSNISISMYEWKDFLVIYTQDYGMIKIPLQKGVSK